VQIRDSVSDAASAPAGDRVSFKTGGAFLRDTRAEVDRYLSVGHTCGCADPPPQATVDAASARLSPSPAASLRFFFIEFPFRIFGAKLWSNGV